MDNHTNDILIKINLTLEEIYSGVTKAVKYKIRKQCTCLDGVINCSTCFGKGLVLKEVIEKVTIPKGVEHGMELEFEGKGHFYEKKKKALAFLSHKKGAFGSLTVRVEEIKHAFFKRDKADLIYLFRVKQSELQTANKTIEIQHLNNKSIKVEIPKNTLNGNILRIQGMGFNNIRDNQIGNLLILTQFLAD